MTDDQSPLELIRANAELVLREARENLGQDIGYDADGVRWLDGFIQRRHDGDATDDPNGLVNTLGSFLGECIVRTYNGSWRETEHGWAVIVDGDLAVFPFNKVHKHLVDGAADSVLSLFSGVPVLIAHTEGGQAAAEEATAAPSQSILGKLGSLFKRR
jgi:hypothetical protein